jgi:ADP-ribosylglycohydrolase
MFYEIVQDFKANTPPIKVGKASPTEGALPGALYFALKYRSSLEEALIANAGVGGDSAARGIVIGMLLGAVHGTPGIPARWLHSLNSRARVLSLFEQLRLNLDASARDAQNSHDQSQQGQTNGMHQRDRDDEL